MRKQKRKYGLFVPDKSATTTLFLDEYVVKEKERFRELLRHKRNEVEALKVLEDQSVFNKDEELQKIQKV